MSSEFSGQTRLYPHAPQHFRFRFLSIPCSEACSHAPYHDANHGVGRVRHSCSPQEDVLADAKNYDDTEAYKVYSAILPQEWPWEEADATTLVIRIETEPYGMCINPDRESGKIVGTAIADYKKKNGGKWLLQREFDIDKPYEMVSSSEIDTIFQTEGVGGWKQFYERHPDSGGWIELSAVGFNPLKTIAVVYAGHFCGGLCGGGTFHVLQKVDGKWIPLRLKGGKSCAWAS